MEITSKIQAIFIDILFISGPTVGKYERCPILLIFCISFKRANRG